MALYTPAMRKRMRAGRCPYCDEAPFNHTGSRLPCKLTQAEVEEHLRAYRAGTQLDSVTPTERTMLGVVVVIAGQRPHQVETWKEALDFVTGIAQGDDPVHVSMFTLYWPAPGEED